ncbi:MAG: glycosyltransferase [Kaiparowitsia implicata GSE-PSE-MK54-09C]|jgi:glycosyltransferase involved in cell wall biosynthesis|nr:glycosyltransferase [Kaiparowitsia implicata GSE-PSE-MK54-09C]
MTFQFATPNFLNRKPVLTIFYQLDPWNASIGGIQTIIRTFLKYSPDEFVVRVVGTATDPSMSLRQWHEQEFEGRVVQFLPLFFLPDDNVRQLIPTTLRYTAALLRTRIESDFMHFHRLEPTLVAQSWRGDKTLFIHNDIHKQMVSTDSKKAILWRHFPQAYFALERSLVHQFSQIFSCNSDSAALYRQLYPAVADQVTLIRNTVDNDVFFPLPQQEQDAQRRQFAQQRGLPDETQFILFAGRLHPQKDPLLLVRALAALQQPHIHLLMAGEGELADEIRAEGDRLQISDRITMLGGVDQLELAHLHQISQALILTSVYEGLPLVALEALASGNPVITTDCGETPKLLSNTSGIVCHERTPAAIAAAIQTVVAQPEAFPVEGCIQVAKPYAAKDVIGHIYSDMLSRWQLNLAPVATSV